MSQQKTKKPKFVSPAGVASYPWLNRPDTKFSEGGAGVYKTDLRLTSGAFENEPYRDGKSFKQWIDELVDASVEEARKEHPKESKKIKARYPYEAETDDTGEETGEYRVKFKQNAEIKRKDGSIVKITIPLFNKAGQVIEDPIYGGSMLQVAFTVRNTWMAKDKEAGVRFDISAVRVLQLAKTDRSASDFGFDVDEEAEDQTDASTSDSSADEDVDF